MDFDLRRSTLIDVRDALPRRRISPVELMELVLARVAATTPSLNAVVSVRDRDALLAEAHAAGERIARGEARPLEGVPLVF